MVEIRRKYYLHYQALTSGEKVFIKALKRIKKCYFQEIVVSGSTWVKLSVMTFQTARNRRMSEGQEGILHCIKKADSVQKVTNRQ